MSFLQRGLDHAKSAQPSLFSGFHGGYQVFLQLVEERHVFDILKVPDVPMYIRKQRLLNPGPAPVLADLKAVYGTDSDKRIATNP